MQPVGASRRPPPRLAVVQAAEWLSPGMVRVVLGGEGMSDFEAGPYADAYVKLHLPPESAGYGLPFDPAEVRATLAREQWPKTRTFTVRGWDPDRRRLTLDFIVHGDEGAAGPWAARAEPGEGVMVSGPGGAYVPDPSAPAHLLIGDESVLPAITVALERLSGGTRAFAVVQVRDAQHELPLLSEADLRLVWVHGGDESEVLDAVQALELPEVEVQAFVHGEASLVRVLRRHLVVDRGVRPERLSASGYWKRDRDDEGWRAEKPQWRALAEADTPGVPA